MVHYSYMLYKAQYEAVQSHIDTYMMYSWAIYTSTKLDIYLREDPACIIV